MAAAIQRPENAFFVTKGDDGWTLPGYIAEYPNVHRAVRFRYRPYIPEERATIVQSAVRMKAEDASRCVSQAIAVRIKSWSLTYQDKDKKTHPAPITAEYVRNLRNQIWTRLADIIVYQEGGSDRDPEWEDEDQELHDDAALQALLGGDSPEEAKLDLLGGNSVAG